MKLMAILTCLLVGMFAAPVHASDLKDETAAAFDRYVRATETRMGNDDMHDGFLVIDRLPPSRQRRAYDRIHDGEIYYQQLHTREEEKSIEIPGGLIHHWVAVIFIPGRKLSEARAVLQNYGSNEDFYKPEVRRSRLLNRNGDDFEVYLQFYEKSIVTAVFNTNVAVHYEDLDATRFQSASRSTRIAEVENVGKKNERELPVGHDRGFLWRLNSYWRVEQRDGGLYLQNESIALTRRVPVIMAWIVNPLLQSIPKALLAKLLLGTRDAMARAEDHSGGTNEEAPKTFPAQNFTWPISRR